MENRLVNTLLFEPFLHFDQMVFEALDMHLRSISKLDLAEVGLALNFRRN